MNPLLTDIINRINNLNDFEYSQNLISQVDAEEILKLSSENLLDILTVASLARAKFKAKQNFTCGIINAKSGRCQENCAFCAQSAHYNTNIDIYNLISKDALTQRAKELYQAGASRYGIVTSGTALSKKELDLLCLAAESIKKEVGIKLCASLGLLTEDAARCLKQAGFSSYHHNLETSASFFKEICTTHDYQQDIETINIAKKNGFRVCAGGIFGLGETFNQRLKLAETLKALNVDSIPINFLNPIPGTPLEKNPLLSIREALLCIAIFRLLLPNKDILICGGREKTLGSWQSWIFAAGANAMMIGNYLTTKGTDFTFDQEILCTLGLKIYSNFN